MNFVYVRPNSDDRSIWTSVLNDDEYRIGPLQERDIVLDIGMHTGSFVARAHLAGSRHIFGFEVNEESFKLAQANVGHLAYQLVNAAVGRSDERASEPMYYTGPIDMPHEMNNGAGNMFAESGTPAPVIALDAILSQSLPVRLVKMDVEGSEWPILYTSKLLPRVQEFVGEWHLTMPEGFAEKHGLPPCELARLNFFMVIQGFQTRFYARTEDMPNPTVGYFHFIRQGFLTGDDFARDLAGRELVCGSVF